MADTVFVGVDTSNYTTSLALADAEGNVIANLKMPLPVKDGACGLRQGDAVFAHVKHLPQLADRLRELVVGRHIAAVGVSATPRNAAGSYMPCFLAGKAAASLLAAGLGVPLFELSHQNGHVMAALYASGAYAHIAGAPFGAFHVSGGTTEMLHVKPCGTDFEVEQVGGTADLNAGQAIDRIGVALGLSFPCGPALEALAAQNTAKVPRPRICVQGGECNLSGLENLAKRLMSERGDAALTAAFTLDFVAETLLAMAKHFRTAYGDLPLLFAGGVMSNRRIAARLSSVLPRVWFADPAYSADNAAGIALLCRARYMQEHKF